MKINNREIGFYTKPYVIAELSGNHNGSLERMLKLIEVANDVGADAVKIQAYTPDTITLNSNRPEFQINGGPWDGRSLYELYQEAHTPPAWWPAIFNYGTKIGITVFASVFDPSAVDAMEQLKCPAYKIASFDITDTHLIKYAARTSKPMIISTGMASRQEIKAAVQAYKSVAAPSDDLALLHCVSAYPTPAHEANLALLGPLSETVHGGVVVGLSDHTLGVGVSAAAVAWGASIIEKHLCMDRSLGGPDADFSLEPAEFRNLVLAVHDASDATLKGSSPSQQQNKKFRKSLYVVKDIMRGEILTTENVRPIRPANGLSPSFYENVLGAAAMEDLKAGTPLTERHVSVPLSL